MPQTGPDLVGAGYPISRPLLALLGGNGNSSQGNVPIATNLDFGMGGLSDVSCSGASTYFMPVPVSPGVVVTTISVLVGATYASVSSSWAALYTGTGSAPGTTGAQPVLISNTGSSAVNSTGAQSKLQFTFSSPVTITAVHAPYGFVYAGVELGANQTVSLLSMTCASIAQYPWFSTSPYMLCGTNASAAAASTAGYIGTVTRVVNPPVVLLS